MRNDDESNSNYEFLIATVFRRQFFEQGQGAFNRLGLDAIRRAEISRCTEIRPGDEEQIIFFRTFAESVIVRLQSLREEIKRALRFDTFKAGVNQPVVQNFSVAFVRRDVDSFPRAPCNDQLPQTRRVDMRQNSRGTGNRSEDLIEIVDGVWHDDITYALAWQ